jgi:hypothetical protein
MTTIAADPELLERLIGLVRSSPETMDALRLVRSLRLQSWCIGAGAVRALVWDALHDRPSTLTGQDVDVAFFDRNVPARCDAALEDRLRSAMPALAWEVTNQAWVHHWFAATLGQAVAPLDSLEDGLATWPEYATCVGVSLGDDDRVGVVAPHGLDDLFALRVRHNPARASLTTYRERVRTKRFEERWPKLSILDR